MVEIIPTDKFKGVKGGRKGEGASAFGANEVAGVATAACLGSELRAGGQGVLPARRVRLWAGSPAGGSLLEACRRSSTRSR